MAKDSSRRSGFWGTEDSSDAARPDDDPSAMKSGRAVPDTAPTAPPAEPGVAGRAAADGSESTSSTTASAHAAPIGSDPVGSDPVGTDPVGSDPVGTDPVGTDPVGSDPVGSDPVGSDSVGTVSATASKPAVVRRQRSAFRRAAARFELPILIVIAVAIAVILKTFVIQPFYIPSESMEQTLHGCTGCSGDRILVFKPGYRIHDPQPGDIVVFKAPDDWDEGGGVVLSSNPLVHGVQWFGQLVGVVPPSEKDLVKRVIATGGQTVQCCDDAGNVQISDSGPSGPWRSLNEPYIYQPSPWTKPATPGARAPGDSRSFGPVTVPEGRLWVMGDHRSDSADSRYHCGDGGTGANCDPEASTVSLDNVIGKAVVIAWPPSRWRTLGTPKTFNALGLPGVGAAGEPAPAAAIAGLGLFGLRRRRARRRRSATQLPVASDGHVPPS
ncbi:MAG: signal peptidase [Frankiales bacterium]|nr:signal peptidase [Frankiales bacterium]